MEKEIMNASQIMDETYRSIQHYYDVNMVRDCIEDMRKDAIDKGNTEVVAIYDGIMNDAKNLDEIANQFRRYHDNRYDPEELWEMVNEAIADYIMPRPENCPYMPEDFGI